MFYLIKILNNLIKAKLKSQKSTCLKVKKKPIRLNNSYSCDTDTVHGPDVPIEEARGVWHCVVSRAFFLMVTLQNACF